MSHTPPVPDANQSPYPRQAPPPPPPALAETTARAAAHTAETERQRQRALTWATVAGIGIGGLAVGAILLLSRDSEAPKATTKRKKAAKKA
ncbi:hypothetical protein ACBY01_07005 [Sphingomonas sp. ac-8]|uniref:hypothetical protein n=1 Tax=Sphingomonas sp. ac-8 TaxID=3242977 RepID=UPI003A7FD3CD